MSWLLVKLAVGVIGAWAAFAMYTANRFRENPAGPRESQPRTSPCESQPGTSPCVLCLGEFEPFDKVTLPCGHRLHPRCARLLFVQEARSCPSCREKISPEFSI